MPRIRLLHWKEEECGPRAEVLRGLGFAVDATLLTSSSLKGIREDPPDAIVIDLSRLPGQGLEVGTFLRKSKTTRLIPLVYVEGAPEKVARVQAALPDARYTTYQKIGPVLEDVLANPVREAVVPQPSAEPVPLAKKLGIKDGVPVGLIHAPKGIESLITGAEVVRNPRSKVPLTLWFVTSRQELEAALPEMHQRAVDGGIWIIWPKTTKTAKPDINGNLVRELALAAGLVDFKICAVDHTWSGMRFAVKK